MQNNSTVAKLDTKALGWFTGTPADINGSVDIGVGFVIARATPKFGLGLSILLLAMSAYGARPAGIARVNSNQYYASESGLVCQETAKLSEGPRVQNCSLTMPNRNPLADTGKIFQFNPAPGAFSFSNDLLRNTVISVSGKSMLPATKFLQAALCRSGLFLLENGSQSSIAIANGLYFTSTVSLAIGSGSDLYDTEIHAKELGRRDWRIGRGFNCAVQVELTVPVYQVCLPFDPVKPLLLILAIDQWHNHATLWKCPETYLVDPLEAHNALVIGNGAVGFEYGTLIFIAREALNGFTYGSDSHLSGQSEACAYFSVGQFVNRRLTEDASVESAASGERGGCIRTFHSFQESGGLRSVWEQLQLERQFHYSGVYHSLTEKASKRPSAIAEILFLCRLKATVSKDQIL